MITIHSGLRDYTVHFPDKDDFLRGFERFSECLYVVDSNVWRLHSEVLLRDFPLSNVVVFPVDEERKCLASVEKIYDHLMERSAKKNMTMISVGGGILQDITGYAATTLYRGVNWIFIPTTLLAQADSCIGSKTSLNYKGFKNLIGTFYPPSEVHIYVPFLTTLEKVDFFSGLGEVIKLHIMGGKGTANQLITILPAVLRREHAALSSAVKTSLEIKQSYMAGDEYDLGRRNLLNFGHCFGHALESTSGYSVPHGQAVVIGMLFANIISKKRGLLSEETVDFLFHKLLLNSIVSSIKPSDLDGGAVLEAMGKDKKRIGKDLVIVLMKDDYTFTKVTDFKPEEALTALEELRALLPDV